MDPNDFDELLNIQKRMQKMIADEKQIDDTVDIIMLINDLAPHPGQRIQREKVLIEGLMRGFNEDYLDKMINKLIKDRILFEPSPGYLGRR